MSDLTANVTWREILRETEAGNIPHCRAISAPAKYHQEIIEALAPLILGSNKPTHPDLLIAGTADKAPPIGDPEKPNYTGSCRWLIENIALMPVEAPRRLGVILNADKLLLPAANSLLKLAEEPPKHAALLFLMEDGRLFLPTLRSRSRFSTITLKDDLTPRKPPSTDAEWLAWLAETRKTGDTDGVISDLESWANYSVSVGDFVRAGRNERLRLIAAKTNLSVPMLCDMILLTLREGNSQYESILDDLR